MALIKLSICLRRKAKLLVDYDKTAKANRTGKIVKYDIDITASSKLTTSTTQESSGVADVMLACWMLLAQWVRISIFWRNGLADRSRMDTNKTYYLKNNG